MKKINGLTFIIETPYIVNFKKPYSTITLLSFSFPPFTTIRGLIANAMGMGDLQENRDTYNQELNGLLIAIKPLNIPDKFSDMVLMKKLKPPTDSKKKKEILNKMIKDNNDLSKLTKKEKILYQKFFIPHNTSSPFIKEYISPIKCRIYLKGDKNLINKINISLLNPSRPLYIGSSDDLVVISKCKPIIFIQQKSKIIDSTVKIDNEIYPLNKKLIVGRVPYRFIKYGTKKRRNYYREDWIIAVPKKDERLELNREINCFKIDNEFIAF